MMAISKCHVNYVHHVMFIMYMVPSAMPSARKLKRPMQSAVHYDASTFTVIILTSILRCT